jgi:hypothetical protein
MMIGQVEGTTIETTVERYFATWNETDAAARQAAIGATWTEDARYRDPLFAADGHTALDGMIAAVHDRFPGYRFRPTTPIDAHHDRAHWGWELAGPGGGAPAATGIDIATVAPDGRLRDVVGFFTSTGAADQVPHR